MHSAQVFVCKSDMALFYVTEMLGVAIFNVRLGTLRVLKEEFCLAKVLCDCVYLIPPIHVDCNWYASELERQLLIDNYF